MNKRLEGELTRSIHLRRREGFPRILLTCPPSPLHHPFFPLTSHCAITWFCHLQLTCLSVINPTRVRTFSGQFLPLSFLLLHPLSSSVTPTPPFELITVVRGKKQTLTAWCVRNGPALPAANRTVTTEKLCIMQITGREQVTFVGEQGDRAMESG